MTARYKSILASSDWHLPYLHKPSFKDFVQLVRQTKPYYIPITGDFRDCVSFHKFTKRISITAKEEIEEGTAMGEEMFRIIRKASPRSKIFLLKGNHDERIEKRLYERFNADWESIVTIKDLWTFPGVETVHDPKEVLWLNDIACIHGWKRPGGHLEDFDNRSVIRGDNHQGGVIPKRLGNDKIIWEGNPGLLGDYFHPALVYRPLKKHLKWRRGCLFVDAWGARFIGLPKNT